MARPIMSSPFPAMDPSADSRDLVIKVKHGDTLRRIGAYVRGQLMDPNMSKLRAKIIDLFKLKSDAAFILTYTDEDGDVVTLDDDDELRDAVINQQLNPLRITVQLKSDISSSPDGKPDTARPAVAESNETGSEPFNIHSVVDESLKSVPEPFRNVISDITGDVLKAAASAPALVQLLGTLSKLGLSNVGQSSHGTGGSSGQTSGVSAHPVGASIVDGRKGSGAANKETETNFSAGQAQKQNEHVNMVPVAESAAPSSDPTPGMTQFDLLSAIWNGNGQLMSNKDGRTAYHDGTSVAIAPTGAAMQPIPVSGGYTGYTDMISGNTNSYSKPLPEDTSIPQTSQIGAGSHFDAPVNRLAPPIPTARLSCPRLLSPHRRSHSFHENASRTLHMGVQCDGCGMHPIAGPRFKSKVKDDYDLCNLCFSRGGDEADYMRIDLPGPRTPRLYKGFNSLNSRHRFQSPNAPHGCGWRGRVKLESRFIHDVTVPDGTVMAPSTPFTKIWRMRNNGSGAWDFGTQLVWVGGDKLGERTSAELQIPANGIPVEGELDIAVDFTAPARAGRYVSYWRMSTVSGQKFGQRVWVLIQVEYYRPDTPVTNAYPNLNLNLPPENHGQTRISIPDINVDPFEGMFSNEIVAQTEAPVKPAEDIPSESLEQAAQPLGGLPDASNMGLSEVPPPDVPQQSLYPLIDLPSDLSTLGASASVPSDDGNQLEQTLLKELEEMGFKQTDLNKEVLRQNKYDLEQSVEDLCSFDEWDPLLAELNQMGFYDKVMNKKLLIKHAGSIKRTVLDLVAGEKSQ